METPEKGGEAALMESGFRANQFLDRTARNSQGERVGKVSDFVFGQNGKIEYLILSYRTDGSEKLIPVPFDIVEVTPGNVALTVDISRDRLTNAPALSEWKDFDNPEWTSEVHSYYESAGELKVPERSSESATSLPPYTEACSTMKMKHQGSTENRSESQRTEPAEPAEPQGGYQ